jgi:hypothetical protein
MIHKTKSPLAGKRVGIKRHIAVMGGKFFEVNDWYDRVAGRSWRSWSAFDAPAEVQGYSVRAGVKNLPLNDEVLVGKILGGGATGDLLAICHVNELEIDGRDATQDNDPPEQSVGKAA